MRILFVVPYVPNLIRVRPYNLIRQLTGRGHLVTVLTLTSNASEEADAVMLEKYCHRVIRLSLTRWRSFWNCFVALPTNEPLQSVYCWQPRLASQLIRLASSNSEKGSFDVIHIEHLRGARYGQHLKALFNESGNGVPVIWDSVDCISGLFRKAANQSKSAFGRWVTRFELRRTELYEAQMLNVFSNILVTSSGDKQLLTSLAHNHDYKAEVEVLSNGVDIDYFKPDPSVERDPATIVISGKMSYHANITMVLRLVKEIMPLVWLQRSDVKVLIVGKDPSREIWHLGDHPKIDVTGTVPDIRPYLQRASLAVAPISYGAGVQNKVLEAMACATPVITDQEVTGSIHGMDGRDFLVAANRDDYAQHILDLLSNPERGRRIGRQGREFVEQHHHWPRLIEDLEEVYIQAVQQHMDCNGS